MFCKNEFLSALAKNGISIGQLADKIGMKKASLYGRIRGEVQFSLSDVLAIAEAVPLTDEQIIAIFLRDNLMKS